MPYLWLKRTDDDEYDVTELNIQTEPEAEQLRAACTIVYVEQHVLDAWHALQGQLVAWNTLWQTLANGQVEARKSAAKPRETWVTACRFCGCAKPPRMDLYEGQDWPRCPQCNGC
jgi:hypothetical protein